MFFGQRPRFVLLLPILLFGACTGQGADATSSTTVTTGSLQVTVSGLPDGTDATVSVTGPGGFSETISSTRTLSDLEPGSYRLSASSVVAGNATYAPGLSATELTVPASTTPTQASVQYSLWSGSLTINVAGLPDSTPAAITVSGPGGSQSVTGTRTLTNLAPGAYTIAASSVTAGTSHYSPTVSTQTIAVTSSTTATGATVTYAPASASLTVTVSGLPAGVSAGISIGGPGGYSRLVTATTTLTALLPGTYTISASNVVASGTTYAPAPASQAKTVSTAAVSASVAYSATAQGAHDLAIAGMYLTQGTQRFAGTVPLVAGRAGFLRVFVTADAANTMRPQVRVRFYVHGVLQSTSTISAPGTSVPISVNEGSLSSSWNLAVPASLIQPGLSILADVDPTNAVAESNETNNTFPVSGAAQSLTVLTTSPLAMTMIPVKQAGNGAQGNISSANKDSYFDLMMRLEPVASYDVVVHAPYTTTTTNVLQSNNTNGAWTTILDEIRALKIAEGSSRTYYGVVHATYSSGIAGIGYIGYGAAIGWDGSGYSEIMAHEIGHTWGRQHSPCGGASGPDPNYPYAGGAIGVYGYDMTTSALHAPSESDIMSYCHPIWISDYTWTAILNWRAAHPQASLASEAEQPCLLVWGRIEDGQVVLEPAFEVTTRPSVPAHAGAYVLRGEDASGAELFRYSFDGEQVADDPSGARHFAWAIPLAGRGQLAALQVAGAGKLARRVSATMSMHRSRAVDAIPARASKAAGGQVALAWDPASYPMVMVRDARTGEILSFARGGRASIASSGTDLELVASDGVRSVASRVSVQ